jgi:hypothetical protein
MPVLELFVVLHDDLEEGKANRKVSRLYRATCTQQLGLHLVRDESDDLQTHRQQWGSRRCILRNNPQYAVLYARNAPWFLRREPKPCQRYNKLD